MCFSATASFGAGIVLTGIGIASIKKAPSRSCMAFAGIPFIFGVQQLSEGMLWVALSNPAYAGLQHMSTYTFMFFAQVLWPVWVPWSILIMEEKKHRKSFQKILSGIGAMVSLYLGYCLLNFHNEAQIIGYHISYIQDYPGGLAVYSGLLYICATILPPFFSSVRRMWILGITVIISYIITTIFYTDYIVSVWCFFASIVSISIWFILHEERKDRAIILAGQKV